MYASQTDKRRGLCRGNSAFTLIELLVVIAVISTLAGMLFPALARARSSARNGTCASNLRQIGMAAMMYGHDYEIAAPPLVYLNAGEDGQSIYWWGCSKEEADYRKGLLYPYLESPTRVRGVMECPSQPWGTYVPPDTAQYATTTYGYNGYYLSPPASGYESVIGDRPWRGLDSVHKPEELFVFGDALIRLMGRSYAQSNCFLDPPKILRKVGSLKMWMDNTAPTTCFRHNERANIFFADGHVGHAVPSEYVYEKAFIGFAGEKEDFTNYVPDWEEWTE